MSSMNESGVEGPSDEALARAVQQGDEEAFTKLVQRYQERVFRVAYRFTGTREDALDVAQEAFVKAYRNARLWRPTGRYGAWLMRVTTNQALDHLRRTRRHRQTDAVDWERSDSEPVASSDTRLDAERSEIDRRVRGALETLSPSQRTAFVLRHYEGYAVAEIAEVLGCGVGSVKQHLYRAIRKLRNELGDLK